MTHVFSAPLKLMFLLGSLLPIHSTKSINAGSDRAPAPSVPLAHVNLGTPPGKSSKISSLPRLDDVSSFFKASPDPIRFVVQSDKQQIKIDEEINLTITAQLLNITPSQLFYVPGSNAYTLKLILPPGFEQTGGDFSDYVSGNLSYASQPIMVYHVRGRFKSVTAGTSFRLLRSHGQASDQSLYAEKATITLQTGTAEKAFAVLQKALANAVTKTDMTLYVIADPNTTPLGSARAAAPLFQGYVDYAACDAVSGWIVDKNNLRSSKEVDIYINGVKAATVLADQIRRDVASSFGVTDFFNYGYVWVIPDYYKSNSVLTISVRPVDTTQELTFSPRRTDVCPGTGTPPATTPPVTTTTTPPVTTTTTPPITTTTTPPATTTTTPPASGTTGGALTMLPPTYNCATGSIRFNTSGGDGTTIRYRATGITGWTTEPNQYLDEGSRVNADTPPFTLYAEQSGRSITYTWSRQATCSTTTPPTNTTTTPPVTTTTTPPVTTTTTPPVTTTTTPPVSGTTGGALTVLPPTYNCATGAIRFNTSGGDGKTIRYRATGITGWTTEPNQYLDEGSRINADTPTFTIYVEQSGNTITYSWSRQATCSGTPPTTTPPVTTTTTPPVTTTTTPPVTTTPPPSSDNACSPAINAISYAWDGGNNSITIRIKATSGSPQIKLVGPTSVDWANTNIIDNTTRFWANPGMNTGTYTLSVRQQADGGSGCSFNFSVPSAGRQLYPATGDPGTGSGTGPVGCTPPSAPTVSTSGGTQVCNNASITLTAAGCSGSVTWSGGRSGQSINVNTAGTYTATCTVNGCVSAPSNQLTVTACTPTSNARYNRVLYVGNSITVHGGSQFFIVNAQNPKRGMAATSPDKDYVHLMSAKHQSLNPSVDNRTFGSWNMGGQLDDATGPYWEGQSTKGDIDLGRFDPVAAWKPDIVYIRLGENVTDWEITDQSTFQNRLKALIDKLISQSPGAKVVLSTSVWDKPNYDRAIRAIGAERNYPIVNFSDMWPNRQTNGFYAINPSIYNDAGTDNHPDDDGMAHIAESLWNSTPK